MTHLLAFLAGALVVFLFQPKPRPVPEPDISLNLTIGPVKEQK